MILTKYVPWHRNPIPNVRQEDRHTRTPSSQSSNYSKYGWHRMRDIEWSHRPLHRKKSEQECNSWIPSAGLIYNSLGAKNICCAVHLGAWGHSEQDNNYHWRGPSKSLVIDFDSNKYSQKVAPRFTKTKPFVNMARYLVVTEFCPRSGASSGFVKLCIAKAHAPKCHEQRVDPRIVLRSFPAQLTH